MTREELKQKWGKYCDTDQLVDDAINLFNKHRDRNSVHGICTMLDQYFTNKEHLIQLFVDSENYIGDMRIAVQREFDRSLNSNDIYHALGNLDRVISSRNLLSIKNADNKTLIDCLSAGKTSFAIDALPTEEEQSAKLEKLREFDYRSGYTGKSLSNYEEYRQYFSRFRNMSMSTLNDNITYGNGPSLKKGMKTSRAFNQVCTHYGLDKMCPEDVTTTRNGETTTRVVYPYDKLFAQYADLVSGLKRNLYFVISLNPLDYLTMSVGVNWNSCHRIDGGGWRGGCMSYMLDKTSMVTFVVNGIEGKIHEIPKYYRQMFHYDNDLFIQNRLYPQGNDGATDLYAKFRGFVIEEFSDMIDVNDDWVSSEGAYNRINSYGTHYRDYNSSYKCATFYPRARMSKVNGHRMNIGHDGVCIYCGETYTASWGFAHDRCTIRR